MDEFTNQLLLEHRLAQRRRFAGTGRNQDGLMFTHSDGRPVRPDWLTHRFAALVKQLDLPPVRFHDVRHAHARLAGAAGVPLKVIQHDVGHSSALAAARTLPTAVVWVLRSMSAVATSSPGQAVTQAPGTAITITSGGNRNPANADPGDVIER